ncbi:carboxylate/amino acid/amine transporter [Thalassovita gelatinovora]|uniref:Carboxylate/amino acid/amine transporter n=1 Tax=Thalassovita gelatinovora TaxID=53501 RepID=A0A0P1F440_THAGE|nr:DMT family transporter [Thalassovita gelatinovora]QIZ79296.1 DMT family transporter [Thalassovita gelatinovora]CUH62523.1 carboxylate/amino acid/amine transporter [Thalassovita gelatinovora]SEQ05923.1 EamA domain-containing membrane protein RarD [Thalassovita gelatinovora]
MTAGADVFKAALWMSGAIASFTSMAVAGRAISFELDTFEIMMYRSFVGIFIVLIVAAGSGTLGQIHRRNLRLHLIRNLCHFTGQNLWFFAITVIPLAQVFALEFTAPLWVVVLSPLLLGERITSIRALAALIGFIGILIIARPTAATLEFGQVAAAMTAIAFAFTAIFTRKLTRSETIISILFYLTVMQAVFGVICAGYDGDITVPSMQSLPWLILIGCAGLLAHFCLTTALSLAPASVVMPIDFTRLPIVAVVGMLVYGEMVDIWVVVGALAIFAGNYLNIWGETRR